MRHPNILTWVWVTCAICLVPATSLAQFTPGSAPPPKKKEKPKETRFERAEVSTNLDEAQQKEAELLKSRYGKIYGWTEEIPENAMQLLRKSVFNTLDGIHRPEKEKTDKLSDEIVLVLREKQLSPNYAIELVVGPAELLSGDEMSKEDFDGLMIEVEQNLAGSRMTTERHHGIKGLIEEIILNAKVNEEKVEAREAARKAEQERQEKERQKKIEEAKKRAQRKSRGSGSESGMP